MNEPVSPLQAVRGMNDILPGQVGAWYRLETCVRKVTAAYGYAEIRPPVIERAELFRRSIGEQTDIVEKEMYTFTDSNGDRLSLRPEATASCVRAGIEHGLFRQQQVRLWYYGPMFRHERPQKGRFRQFHQFGVEAFGWEGPDIDAEIILLGERLWRELGIGNVRLEINTLGGATERAAYRRDLVEYLETRRDALDPDSQRRLQGNPLRVLDSKVETTREILNGAPRLLDYLAPAQRTAFDQLLLLLDDNGVRFEVNTRLVRGLDYYTGAVFEWITDELGAQNAVCAGGRYDGLVTQLGGDPVPGAGFAMGAERIIELVGLQRGAAPADAPDAYLATVGEVSSKAGLRLAEAFRREGLNVVLHCGGGGLKRQLKLADRSGARFALVVGEDELRDSTITVKPLRDDAAQRRVSVQEAARILRPASGLAAGSAPA